MISVCNVIDETLSIYRNKKVIIWGCGEYGKRIYSLLKYFGIKIYAYCDNNELLWETIEVNSGVPIISPMQLHVVARENKNIVVQIGCFASDNSLQRQIQELVGFDCSYISVEEAMTVLGLLRKEQVDKTAYNKLIKREYAEKYTQMDIVKQINQYICDEFDEMATVICSPPKTGNITLGKTFERLEYKYASTRHMPKMTQMILSDPHYKTVKVITAVREPIAQNLSILYQYIAGGHERAWTLVTEDINEWIYLYKDGGDVQKLFDRWMQSLGYNEDATDCSGDQSILHNHIQSFIPEFQKEVLDIMKYPFDKEKGYTIIREGRIEVFVYQLEKMNEIIEPFSEFIGKPLEQWVRSNEASEKWIADSYTQAQQELKFSQEYFDKCYNEPYVKHFYSEVDIEKFGLSTLF